MFHLCIQYIVYDYPIICLLSSFFFGFLYWVIFLHSFSSLTFVCILLNLWDSCYCFFFLLVHFFLLSLFFFYLWVVLLFSSFQILFLIFLVLCSSFSSYFFRFFVAFFILLYQYRVPLIFIWMILILSSFLYSFPSTFYYLVFLEIVISSFTFFSECWLIFW